MELFHGCSLFVRVKFKINLQSIENQLNELLFMAGTESECWCDLCVQVGIWPTQLYPDIHLTSRPPDRAATRRPHWLEWFLVSISRQQKVFAISMKFKMAVFV